MNNQRILEEIKKRFKNCLKETKVDIKYTKIIVTTKVLPRRKISAIMHMSKSGKISTKLFIVASEGIRRTAKTNLEINTCKEIMNKAEIEGKILWTPAVGSNLLSGVMAHSEKQKQDLKW